ncbi:hypothetical protein M9Y10_001383 [Tritrichomonas musculus]|uniref:non-specific serine/threonine protein kinase n=1 Tax=Tritrichomonas musculus TaxID=1915356 RepID=A0ABR2L6V1_9EUKA
MSSSQSTYSYSSSGEHPPIEAGTIVGEYEVFQLIGEGGYGQIYEVIHKITNRHYGMKVEYLSTHHKGLTKEIEILKNVQASTDFPEFLTSGKMDTFQYYIMELLGPSLSQLCTVLPTKSLSRYTLLHAGIYMIRCIQSLHNMGYIHRDIKPGNFLIRPVRKHPICIIDFGLARKYVAEDGHIKPPRKHPGYTGTYRYASLNAHDEKELSRRDDLMSWFYSMVHLADGRLPWPSSSGKKITIQMKREMKPDELCEMLTPEFIDIYNMICALEYEETPNYDGIVDLIKKSISNSHFSTNKYDWELLNPQQLKKITVISLTMDREVTTPENSNQKIDKDDSNCCFLC